MKVLRKEVPPTPCEGVRDVNPIRIIALYVYMRVVKVKDVIRRQY